MTHSRCITLISVLFGLLFLVLMAGCKDQSANTPNPRNTVKTVNGSTQSTGAAATNTGTAATKTGAAAAGGAPITPAGTVAAAPGGSHNIVPTSRPSNTGTDGMSDDSARTLLNNPKLPEDVKAKIRAAHPYLTPQ